MTQPEQNGKGSTNELVLYDPTDGRKIERQIFKGIRENYPRTSNVSDGYLVIDEDLSIVFIDDAGASKIIGYETYEVGSIKQLLNPSILTPEMKAQLTPEDEMSLSRAYKSHDIWTGQEFINLRNSLVSKTSYTGRDMGAEEAADGEKPKVRYFVCIGRDELIKIAIQFKPLILYADDEKTKIWKILIVAFIAKDDKFGTKQYAIESKQESSEVIQNARVAMVFNTADVTGRRFNKMLTYLETRVYKRKKSPELWAFGTTVAFCVTFTFFVLSIGGIIYYVRTKEPDIIQNTDIEKPLLDDLCDKYPTLPECAS